jgi:hypothetical protein
MPKRVVAHLKGNIWLWIAGVAALGALAILVDMHTPGAFLFMATGILIVMASAHVDPLEIITTDALHPEDADAPVVETGRTEAGREVT